jgi:hypothetical protein
MCQRGNCPSNNLKLVDGLLKDTAEIETGMVEKSSPGTRQKDNNSLVWFGENSQIINAYFYLLFFLLIILWPRLRDNVGPKRRIERKPRSWYLPQSQNHRVLTTPPPPLTTRNLTQQ